MGGGAAGKNLACRRGHRFLTQPPEEYRRRAEEAERLAAKAIDAVEREAFERIARAWRDLEKRQVRKS